jgi:AAA+ superfamily predicted ATPase
MHVVDRLQEIFTTASRWDAVLLLDEADVLLEKRSYEDLKRNGIVSGGCNRVCFSIASTELRTVFLRMLEYYEGILFLTTNRVETMDVAFQSRIHIAIKYKPLNFVLRRKIWENFIIRLDEREVQAKEQLSERLDDLAKWELNGRQIRNVLAIAESLALSSGARRGALRYHHVEGVANQTLDFQDFFEDANKERKGQVGEINGRQFQERWSRGFR